MPEQIYWEDFNIGYKLTTPGRTLSSGVLDTLTCLAGFVLPLFLDEEYAKQTAFKGRIAPGRVILCLMGGLVEQSRIWDAKGVIALVGIDKVRIRSPLRAGDTIRVEMEIIHKELTSKGDRGLITDTEICKNQRGEVVAEAEVTHLLRCRPKE